jgi:lipopolysaccharide biosynthesis protein
MKALRLFIKNPIKKVNADDLANPIQTYETSIEFLTEDIQKFRDQKLNLSNFDKLHPYQYDIDKVDLKYMMHNRLV